MPCQQDLNKNILLRLAADKSCLQIGQRESSRDECEIFSKTERGVKAILVDEQRTRRHERLAGRK